MNIWQSAQSDDFGATENMLRDGFVISRADKRMRMRLLETDKRLHEYTVEKSHASEAVEEQTKRTSKIVTANSTN